MATIYLSSTYSDLIEQRNAVYRTLRVMGHDVKAMEDYVATDRRPLDKCRPMLQGVNFTLVSECLTLAAEDYVNDDDCDKEA